MKPVTEIAAYKAMQAIPYLSQREAEKSMHSLALRTYEPVEREIRRTAGWYVREDLNDGPKFGYLINLQVGMLIQLIHGRKPESLVEIVSMVRGPIRREIEMQFGHKKKKWSVDDLPRPKKPKACGSKRALTDAEKERILEWRIANPVNLHCDWATKPDGGLPMVIRPRRPRGPRLNQEDTPGAREWYSGHD